MRRFLLVATALAVGFVLVFAPVLRKLDYGAFPGRASWQLPERVIEALSLAPTATVADIGAGDGYFTTRLADALPEGRVYAVDVEASIVEALRERTESLGYDNVEVVLAATSDAALPVSTIDVAIVCNVYHHIDDRVSYFAALRTYLTDEGRVAIVEVGGGVPERWLSPPGHSTPVEELEREMAEAGYRVAERFDFLPVQDFVIFTPAR